MKILLFEYITGGGLAGFALPAALAREGSLMATALAADLSALPDVELLMPWDARLPLPDFAADARVTPPSVARQREAGDWPKNKFLRRDRNVRAEDKIPPGAPLLKGGNSDCPSVLPGGEGVKRRIELRLIKNAGAFQRCWAEALVECDAVWPVAPETGGVLENLCQAVQQSGRRLLSSPAAAVALTASKRAASKRLAAHGVAVAPSYAMHELPVDMPWPRVVKPDDGVGCEGGYRLDNPQAWAEHLAGVNAENLLAQPFIEGPALSLSALFYRGEALLLAVNRQLINVAEDGRFGLTGCEVNSVLDANGEYADLARRIARAVPELAGYAGVDFILSANGPLVLEINPRLTSSYAVLSRALQINPARLVLDLFEQDALPKILLGPGRAESVVW